VSDQDSLATMLMVSRLVPADQAKPLNASEFWKLCDVVGSPRALLGCSHAELTRQGVAPDLASRLVRLFHRSTAMAFSVDELDQSGITALTASDTAYPKRLIRRLGTKAPPLLYVAGELSLLEQAGLGVVGSRDVSAEGGDAAKSAAERAARLGLPVVSGGAGGVDQLAMNAAFQLGGAVVGFLADSLLRTVRKPDIRNAIRAGAAVMCTPYNPAAGFSAGNAMGRNKLVYAQARATLVVASDSGSGGTWTGAVEALSKNFGRVGVWRGPGEGPGNAELVERGATVVSSIDQVEELLHVPESEDQRAAPALSSSQPSLF